jgi:hypothetical protein
MATETLSTSLTEIVNSEYISTLIMMYGYDAMVIAPLCRTENLAGRATASVSFPQWELDAVSAVTTEGTTTLSNVELQTTEIANVTAAQVGILREVTELAKEVNMLGPDGLERFIVEDGGRLCMLNLENDLAALLSGFTTTVGSTGVDFSVANFVQAIATLDTKNARGQKVCVLDDQQAFDLRAAVAASTAGVFANSATAAQSVLNANSNGFVGELFGVPIWLTNLTDTANTGADVVGAMFINGATDPGFAGFGIALLWQPRVKMIPLPDQVSDQIAITMAYGVGRISDFGCDLTTDA